MDFIRDLMRKQRDFFEAGATLPYTYRLEQLEKLYRIVKMYETEVNEALAKDFAKPPFETYLTEVGFLLTEIRHTIKHLKRWMKPARVKTAIAHVGGKGYIVPEPFGLTLIIAPWNYPFQLTLAPLIAAIAAGNCAVIKPSELTPHTSALVTRICREAFDPAYIAVVEGDAEVSTALLAERWDLIFFTGSTKVGHIVAEAAAKHLTPVVLELGGKSPTIVHRDAKLELAAKRIVWGKFVNAGQTCVAPDYILVHRSVKNELIQSLKKAIETQYGDVLAEPNRMASIITDRHFARLSGFLKDGDIAHGGRTDPARRLIEPTLLTGIDWNDSVMQEEVFGPILPILDYEDINEVMGVVKARPKPLALYLFTEDKNVQRKVIRSVPFGGGCINDTVVHLGSPYLPFGGVGASGTGSYHGKFGFDAFSHHKGILKQTTLFDMKIKYGRTEKALKLLKWIMR